MAYSDYSISLKEESVDGTYSWAWVPGTGTYNHGTGSGGNLFTQRAKKLSDGHPYQLLGKTKKDIGGAFYVSKVRYEFGPRADKMKNVRPVSGGADYLLSGYLPVWQSLPSAYQITGNSLTTDFSEPAVQTLRNTMGMDGATAIARTTPTRSNASLGITLLEFKRDGLPQIVGADLLKKKCKDYRSYGSEYLNVEFGWKPFISDLKKSLRVSLEAHETMDRYYAEANRLIHRRYTFPTQETTATIYSAAWDARSASGTVGGTQPWDASANNSRYGWREVVDSTSTKTWFSGAFRYYAPQPSDTVLGQLDQARRKADYLYGINLDPETLWNVAPWTWLPDYATNLGDIVTNISTFITEGDILQYGYIMRSTQATRSIYAGFGGPVRGATNHYAKRHYETKARFAASPFGFGVSPDSLTESQWAILVALGLSKGKRSGGNFAM